MSYLSTKNPHPRDAHIHFDEGPHKYTIQGINGVTAETEFTSVTTLIHQQFSHFDAKKVIAAMMRNEKKWNDPIANAKYYGKTAEEIEEMWSAAGRDASEKGTAMHYKIECFYNTPPTTPRTLPTLPTLPTPPLNSNTSKTSITNTSRLPQQPPSDPTEQSGQYSTKKHESRGLLIWCMKSLTRPPPTRPAVSGRTPPRHLRLEAMPRNNENQPRKQIRNPPSH